MSMFYKIYRNKFVPPAEPTASFTGQTIVVTGANTGLGLEAAIKFALLGASRVILGVRSEAKGAKAKNDIKSRIAATTDNKVECVIDVWSLDMSSYESIKAFSRRVESELESVDVIVLNAGVYKVDYAQSQYGWEETLQVNVLSTTLLALLLLPTLKNLGSSRKEKGSPIPSLVIVSSGLHQRVNMTEEEKSANMDLLDHFNKQEPFAGAAQYGRSKLFLMYALATLTKLSYPQGNVQGTPDVWVTAVCPGACTSELSRGYDTFLFRVLKQVAAVVFLRTTEEGARSYLSAATLGEKGHGGFWQSDEVKPPAPLLEGEEGKRLQEKVWQEIVEALKKDVPEVTSLV